MHILIPYAGAGGPRCSQALKSLELPHLRALVQSWSAEAVSGLETSLTPLHERLHAQAVGLPTGDGLIPWAALQAQDLQLPQAHGTGWAWLTLCHWTINADHVEMFDPRALEVSTAESSALMEAMRSFFAEDDIALYQGQGGQWLASGEVFRDLPTASLDRASGAPVDGWMPRQPQAKPLRRLQNEMQMLLYTHPINDARAQQRKPSINSFWVSATGSLPQQLPAQAANFQYIDTLQQPLRQDDASAWLAAWKDIDARVLPPLMTQRASAGETSALTLCGTAQAVTYTRKPQNLWTRLTGRLRKPDLTALLTSL